MLEKSFQEDYTATKKSNHLQIVFPLKKFVLLLSYCHPLGIRLLSFCDPILCYPFANRSGFSGQDNFAESSGKKQR